MSILPIFIPHAGCLHQCVFCNQKTISGQKTAALQGAKEQIARWRDRLRPSTANEAAFYGGSFTALPLTLQEKLLQLTDELLAEGFIGSVRLSTRPDNIDAERLDLLRKHKVALVELGVQSLDDAVLAAAERGHDAQAVYAAHALLRQYGFKTGLQLMVGMPLQNFASLVDTAFQAAALKPDVARIYPLLVLKDTPLATAYKEGRFAPLALEEAVEQCAMVYRILAEAGIKVIRTGLQADEELCAEGNIVAGPFHPALGEMVKSCLLREEVTPALAELVEQGVAQASICYPAGWESQVRGQKNANLHYWQQLFPVLKLSLRSQGERLEVIPEE